jgi:hypothetical protein
MNKDTKKAETLDKPSPGGDAGPEFRKHIAKPGDDKAGKDKPSAAKPVKFALGLSLFALALVSSGAMAQSTAPVAPKPPQAAGNSQVPPGAQLPARAEKDLPANPAPPSATTTPAPHPAGASSK